jgi:hypothetical protein
MQTPSSASIRAAVALTVVLWLGFTIPAGGQQASGSPAAQDKINQQLLDRIQELEKQVQGLKGQPAAAPMAAVPPPEPVAEPPAVHEVAPRLLLNVFGDVGFEATDRKAVTSNTFEIGSLDIFMTARLSPKLSLLGEVLFIPSEDNSISPDVERLLLQYRQSD